MQAKKSPKNSCLFSVQKFWFDLLLSPLGMLRKRGAVAGGGRGKGDGMLNWCTIWNYIYIKYNIYIYLLYSLSAHICLNQIVCPHRETQRHTYNTYKHTHTVTHTQVHTQWTHAHTPNEPRGFTNYLRNWSSSRECASLSPLICERQATPP